MLFLRSGVFLGLSRQKRCFKCHQKAKVVRIDVYGSGRPQIKKLAADDKSLCEVIFEDVLNTKANAQVGRCTDYTVRYSAISSGQLNEAYTMHLLHYRH